jgi:uroporphyrinogen III methyltransferase/synthase
MSGPLDGVRVLVTRPPHQAAALATPLEALGARVTAVPAIAIRPVADHAPLDRALDALATYDWLTFTSVNAVDLFFERLGERAMRVPDPVKVAAIGPSTAAALAERGVAVKVVPPEYRAESLLDAMLAAGAGGKRVLLPRARVAREVLPEGLRAAGATVDVLPLYDAVPPEPGRDRLREIFDGPGIDVVTFTSSSTVEAFGDLAPSPLPAGLVYACLGPITARTAAARGFAPLVVADTYTVDGLVDALVRHYSAQDRSTRDRSHQERSGKETI